MIITAKKETQEKAAELLSIIDRRKKLEATEKALKAYFKALMQTHGGTALISNGVLITLVDAKRSGLDKKALIADHGVDFVDAYMKETHYQKMEVKQA